MRAIFILLFSLSLISCGGLSEKEKQNIVDTTCAVLQETDASQGAFRIKELNLARNNLDEEVFTGGDDVAYDAIKFGLCESLVVNSPDFTLKFTTELEQYKKEFIVNSCEKLDMSYIPSRLSFDDEFYYQLEMLVEESRNEEFINEVNTKKIALLHQFMTELKLPLFDGNMEDFIRLQFLGLCESLLQNDTDFIHQRLHSYRTIQEMYKQESKDFFINFNNNYISNDNQIYFEKYFRVKESDYFHLLSYINIDSLVEHSDLDFDGTNRIMNKKKNQLTTSDVKFIVQDGKYKNFILFYDNNNKKSLINIIDDQVSEIKKWFINENLASLEKVNNNNLIYEAFYDPNGDFTYSSLYINDLYWLGTDWEFKKTCYKRIRDIDAPTSEVDMKFCQ